MKMPIDKEWFEKRAAAEGDHEIGAGLPTYVPPFIPSEAERYYGAVIARLHARIAELEAQAAPKDHVTVKTESSWQWWAGADEEWCTVGPEDSREEIIHAATNDCLGEFQDEEGRWKLGFHIVEARQDPLRLADWIEADELLNRAEDGVADSDRVTSEYDDGPYFECAPAQKKDFRERIERACDEWQSAHGLVFTCRTFSHTRKNEHVVVEHPSPVATTEGPDRG